MCFVPPAAHSEMVKMVNFLCKFYHRSEGSRTLVHLFDQHSSWGVGAPTVAREKMGKLRHGSQGTQIAQMGRWQFWISVESGSLTAAKIMTPRNPGEEGGNSKAPDLGASGGTCGSPASPLPQPAHATVFVDWLTVHVLRAR